MASSNKTAASHAASLFSRPDNDFDEENPGLYAMSFRLPVFLAASIAVMAKHTGQSRNDMVQLIIRAGIDAISREIPQPIREELSQAITDQIPDFL